MQANQILELDLSSGSVGVHPDEINLSYLKKA